MALIEPEQGCPDPHIVKATQLLCDKLHVYVQPAPQICHLVTHSFIILQSKAKSGLGLVQSEQGCPDATIIEATLMLGDKLRLSSACSNMTQ